MRPARLATALTAVVFAAGLLQAPAWADEGAPVGGASETGDPADPTDPVEPSDPVDPTIPVPQDVVVSPSVDGTAAVTFVLAPTDAVLVGIRYSVDGGATWRTAKSATPTGAFTIKGLDRGTPYTVILRAVTGDSQGASSAPVDFIIPFRPVVMEVDGKVVRSGATVNAGAEVRFLELPPGATVVITDEAQPKVKIPVTATKRVRIAKSDPLPPAREFAIRVETSSGLEVASLALTTKDAPRFDITVWPTQANLGAGVPLVVNFSRPVRDKAAAERALKVTASNDFGRAGWFWASSSKAVFRPKKYWPGNTTVRLDADLSTVRGADGLWGPDATESRFKVGDQVILRVNLDSHRMKYFRNGELVNTLRISGGKAGWLTESGVKILTAKIPHKRLYNPDPEEGWDVNVRWAIRVNDNGEYIHDATWNYSIGYANTSHGCTNLTYSDMSWLWNNTKFGDVAIYTGSSARIGTDDYLAGYWNYSWAEWKKGSALSAG